MSQFKTINLNVIPKFLQYLYTKCIFLPKYYTNKEAMSVKEIFLLVISNFYLFRKEKNISDELIIVIL